MKALLQGIFICLNLKDNKFQTFEAASEQLCGKISCNPVYGEILSTLIASPDPSVNLLIVMYVCLLPYPLPLFTL